jgi:glycosyltransferase involved in cell wall biosynthesis
LRLAVVSPFLDRRHGTERAVVESLERFALHPGAEIHLYSQSVQDLAGVADYPCGQSSSRIFWHKVPAIPGPHLLRYLWWFIANHLQRFWDSRVRGLKFDLLYSPGINAFAVDAISVHIVFREFRRRVRPRLRLRGAAISRWPVMIHRRLYYSLICFLESLIYARKRTALTAISQHSADCLKEFYGRDDVCVIQYGVDANIFHPAARRERRDSVRSSLRIDPSVFCLLLIGNDWKNKGLDALLRALAECAELPLSLLVAGSDDRREYLETIEKLGVKSVRFLEPSQDVMQFYAAADAYVGPSLEDAYGLPILEAMACGLPVIASSRAGASEIVRDGENGLILHDAEDPHELAVLVRRLCSDSSLCSRLGEQAACTAATQSWDQNAAGIWEFLEKTAARKQSSASRREAHHRETP